MTDEARQASTTEGYAGRGDPRSGFYQGGGIAIDHSELLQTSPLREAEGQLNDRMGALEANISSLLGKIAPILVPTDIAERDKVPGEDPQRSGSDLCASVREWTARATYLNEAVMQAARRVDL